MKSKGFSDLTKLGDFRKVIYHPTATSKKFKKVLTKAKKYSIIKSTKEKRGKNNV